MPRRALKVLFTPYIMVELGGTMGDLKVEAVEVDWSDTCQGSYIEGEAAGPKVGHNALAENHASKFIDEAQELVEQALDVTGMTTIEISPEHAQMLAKGDGIEVPGPHGHTTLVTVKR